MSNQNQEDAAVVPETNSFKLIKYLFAFNSRSEVERRLRTMAVRDSASLVPDILDAWDNAQSLVDELETKEPGIADAIKLEKIPENKADEIRQLLDFNWFKQAFPIQTGVAIVEIDKLVAPQREVDLEYVDQLFPDLASEPSFDDLVKICLSPARNLAPIKSLEVGPHTHVFSSPSTDFRFLGSYLKDLSPEDIKSAPTGGIPTAAIVSYIGYGAPPINIYWSGKRAVLNNGFHRVYALRRHGVSKIPVVVQNAQNIHADFPPFVIGLPKEYLLGARRPVLIKDFFEKKFCIDVLVQKLIRTIKVHVDHDYLNVPV